MAHRKEEVDTKVGDAVTEGEATTIPMVSAEPASVASPIQGQIVEEAGADDTNSIIDEVVSKARVPDGSMAPGAIAVPGQSQPNPTEGLDDDLEHGISTNGDAAEEESTVQQQETSNNIENESMDDDNAVVVVQATPVQEIVATQVIPESDALPRVPIQQVDIDNFNDPAHSSNAEQGRSKDDELLSSSTPPIYRIAFVVTVVVVVFVLVAFVIFGLALPSEDEIEIDEDDTECAQVHADVHLSIGQCATASWLMLSVGTGVISLLLYHFLNICQERYCVAPEHRNEHPSDFFFNLTMFLLECLWLLTVIPILVFIQVEEIYDPSERLEAACIDREKLKANFAGGTRFSKQEKALDEMQDLKVYYIAASTMVFQLIFLLIARGRLLFSNRSCDNIAPFWKKFWYWLKIMLEVELFILAVVVHSLNLLHVEQQVEDFEP